MVSNYLKNDRIAIKEQEAINEEETLCDRISPCTFIGRGIKFLKKRI